MSIPDQPSHVQRHDEPRLLWGEVLRARRVVALQRRLPTGKTSWTAQDDLLRALEAYAGSLSDHGRPIPYVLRDELRLRRLTR